jgi:hypothetical protein
LRFIKQIAGEVGPASIYPVLELRSVVGNDLVHPAASVQYERIAFVAALDIDAVPVAFLGENFVHSVSDSTSSVVHGIIELVECNEFGLRPI